MRDPAFYPGAPNSVEVRETHISWVFLVGRRAFKLKKPVVFPFLDYGSVERRRLMCEREVELNRRFAPEVYLGVRSIVRRQGRLQLAPSGAGAIEHVVEMRRFDDADTLAARASSAQATSEQVEAVARRLAHLHAEAPSCTPPGGDAITAIKRHAGDNFEALLDSGVPSHARVHAAQRFTDAFLEGHAAAIVARAAMGLVRSGHGDLRAEHVLLGEQTQFVDCAEFNADLRNIDVGADLAFLVMDLHRLGRADLAQSLVDAYRQAGGDPGDDALIAFHAAVKAWVRAKVALLGAQEHVASSDGSATPEGQALELFALGERLAWRARRPLALVICGAPATGKSALAQSLSELSGLAVISSDETRKRLHGLESTQRAPEHAYTDLASERTYSELGRRASKEIDRAGSVIVDATFGRTADRHTFADAFADRMAPLVFECRASADVVQDRARSRERDAARTSDADAQIAAHLRERFQPLDRDVAPERHFVLRGDQSTEQVVRDVVELLDHSLAQPVQASTPATAL